MIHRDNAFDLRKRGIIRILVEAILLAAVRESLHRDIGGRAYVAVFFKWFKINELKMANEEIGTGKGEVVIFNPDEDVRLEVRIEGETVWLTRHQISALFGRDIKTIGKHIANALNEELKDLPTVAKFATVQKEGERKVTRFLF